MVQQAADPHILEAWARANRIGWFLLDPEDSAGWAPAFLARAVFRCEGFRVFRFPD